MAKTLVRQTIIKLEFGEIEKVSDGVTEHYEYDDTEIKDLTDKQWEEIRSSDVMKTFIRVTNEIFEIVKDIWKVEREQIANLANTIVDHSKQLEAEMKRIEKQKAKDDDKKQG